MKKEFYKKIIFCQNCSGRTTTAAPSWALPLRQQNLGWGTFLSSSYFESSSMEILIFLYHFHLYHILRVLQWKYWYYCNIWNTDSIFCRWTCWVCSTVPHQATRTWEACSRDSTSRPLGAQVGCLRCWSLPNNLIQQPQWSSIMGSCQSWLGLLCYWNKASEVQTVSASVKTNRDLPDTPPRCRKCDNHLRIQTSSLVKVTGMVMFNGPSIGSKGIK